MLRRRSCFEICQSNLGNIETLNFVNVRTGFLFSKRDYCRGNGKRREKVNFKKSRIRRKIAINRLFMKELVFFVLSRMKRKEGEIKKQLVFQYIFGREQQSEITRKGKGIHFPNDERGWRARLKRR